MVDLACGETIPAEIIAALTDADVTKWAFNAQFERICLSRWLRKNGNFNNTGYSIPEDTVGNYLNPASWKCTMIWSAYMGLPLSLEGVGAVLGLGKQKMTEGKELIKYFCQPCAPTKTNGGRTRNLPENAPDKWDSFKRYNIRDVEVEMSIQEKLAKFAYRSGMLFITLPSGRRLSYVKPKLGTNQFGGECITYEGIGGTKKWERLETYGPKLVENIVQATSRDILCYAMQTLSHCFITMHIHDELVIEAAPEVDLNAACEQMGRTPPWAAGLKLRADGYETMFYKKD